ncbi:MAG: ABC transporter ATP-binding protein [bacterium]
MFAIKTESLRKIYKTGFGKKIEALQGLDLEIEEGETFGYLGPNGAGKTTTLKLLLGLMHPTSGTAYILGENSRNVQVKNLIGFLPEQPYFYSYLTAHEFLNFYSRLFNIPKKSCQARIDELLALVGLKGRENLQLRKFSKGMLQRIGIAQALVNDPQVIFFDEPFSGLDPIGRKEIRDIVLKLKEKGKTIFFCSHILSDVEMICDRVAILVHGELKAVGRIENLVETKLKSAEIAFSGLGEEAKAKVRELSSRMLDHSDKTLVTLSNRESVDKVVKIISEGQGRLISLTPIRETLEDIFLKEVAG